MRFRSTLILAILFFALGGYLYFVEFQRAAEESKKKTLFSFDTDAVTDVKLAYPDREINLKRNDGTWQITAPIEAAADETAVKNLVRAIADCEVKKTLDDVPKDLAPFGLDKPSVTVTVHLKDKELPAIRVGKTSPVGFSTYLQRADQAKIYLTSSAFKSGMEKQVKDLRDKTILEFKDQDVHSIALQRPAETLQLEKQDSGWKIEKPAAYKADEAAVRSLLSSLRSLRAMDFPSEKADDLAKYGLDQPRLTVVLGIGADKAETTLLVGKEDKEKKRTYVKVGNRPTIFEVGDWVYRDFNKNLGDLRDKTILALSKNDVASIEVSHTGGGGFTLKKDAAGKWSIEGVQGQPDNAKVEAFLGDLVDLKGYEIADEHPTDLTQYGLAAPALTITARDKNGTVLGQARFGRHVPKPPTTEFTAQREGQPTVFHVREYQFDRIDKKAADFLPKPTPTVTPRAAGATATPAPTTGTAS
jgi:Domain of unknown function (DUF4340)